MFIYGGLNIEKGEVYNDLYKFSNNTWTKLIYGSQQGISKVLFGNSQESRARFGNNILYYDSKILFFNGGNFKNVNIETEYIDDDELKPKSISAKKKMDLIFTQPSILVKFVQFAQNESNEDLISVKKLILESKKPKTNKKQITDDIMKLLQNFSIIQKTNNDIDLDKLETEIDSYLIGMIHRFSYSDYGSNCFDLASQKVAMKKCMLKSIIHSDNPEILNQNFLFKTYHKIGFWLFSIGGTNIQNFQKILNSIKDCTKEEQF